MAFILHNRDYFEIKPYLLSKYNADIGKLSALTPTVTFASGSATTISGGIKVWPKLASSTEVDTTGTDPQMLLSGIAGVNLPVTSTDAYFSRYLTNGSGQAAGWTYTHRFFLTGQVFEMGFRARNTKNTGLYRIIVNGEPLTADFVTASVTASSRYLLKVDFGSVDKWLVEIEFSNINEFFGFFIEPTASMTATKKRPSLSVMGDSLSAGANGTHRGDTYCRHLGRIFDMDFYNLAIGGTGYCTAAGTTSFIDRLADVTAVDADIHVVWGGQNDAASFSATVYEKATAYIRAVKAASTKKVLVVIIGMYQAKAADTTTANSVTTQNALKQAAEDTDCLFINLYDPENLASTASAWAASTAYKLGNFVFYGQYVWRCKTAHTSSSTFDITKWMSTSFVTGTGNAGALAADGNADIFISNDALHPTPAMHKHLAYFIADKIINYLATT